MEIRIESGRYKAAYRPEKIDGGIITLTDEDMGEIRSMLSQARSTMPCVGADRATMAIVPPN